ncbi:leucine Rich repeat-containing domain protein [Oesophagostomum dentatum]|uniref:Leucine Rich repeat-containing domain protein n=1 Tax=Oesophagostomum dentatum TaxID=61180 RepID=A0A0B1T5J7_OESDE|nr:leucine Rich repeat-containing domain protein [Oesophagostomum dentatum]
MALLYSYASVQYFIVAGKRYYEVQITFIPNMAFARLRLIVLTLSNNRITHLEKMSLPPSLSILELKNNLLTQIPYLALKEKAGLQVLDLDGNNISALHSHPEVHFKNDIRLVLRNNKIQTLTSTSFKSFRKFKELDLSYNQLMDKLQILKLNNNRIRTIDTMTFAELRNLRHLDLSNNEISWIHPQAFSNMPALETLLLDNNRLEGIDRSAFHRIARIETLSLSHNQLKSFSCEQLGSVQTIYNLNIAHNRIAQIDLTCILRSLVRLDLGHNFLETIRKNMMDGADRLLEITLRNNGILELQGHTFSCCPKLSVIDLSHNHLKTIQKGAFTDQELLSRLDISFNALQTFQHGCFGKNNLLNLDVAFNELTKVPTEALQSTSACLSSLNLDKNRIRALESSQFHGLHNLTRLVISRNFIESIEDAAFEHLPALKYLDISHNPISTWSPTAFRDMSSSMDSLNLANTGLFSMPRMDHHAIRHFNLSM